MRKTITFLLMTAILALATGYGLAQPVASDVSVAPMRVAPPAFKLENLGLSVDIDGQKAVCILEHTIYNPGDRDIEVDYLAPLPEKSLISNLVLIVNETEMKGDIYDKDKAHGIYREIVARAQDPALLDYSGRDQFRARIFPVAAKGRSTIRLKVELLLPKDQEQVALNFPVAGPMSLNQTVKFQDYTINIKNNPDLKNVYSPLDGLKIEHNEEGSVAAAMKIKDAPALDRLSLFYNLKPSVMGGLVLSHKPSKDEPGFFLFLADPSLKGADLKPMAKDVVFVVDKSGSMSGEKIRHAAQASRFVLDRLAPEDNFGLIDYNGTIFSFKDKLVPVNDANRKAAHSYIKGLTSGGYTNIEGALKAAFKMFGDSNRPGYILFLTDGEATRGETDEMKLAQIARDANKEAQARLFSFGVGFEVNSRLLDRLSGQAGGTTVFVTPDENIEAKVAEIFNKMTSPALTRPKLASTLPLTAVIPEEMPDIFIGGQAVVVGRYGEGGPTEFRLKGRVNGEEVTYTYEVELANGPTDGGDFIQQLWAQRRIGELMDQIDLNQSQDNKELVDELISLSKRYAILTPYTSFLALEEQAITNDANISGITSRNMEEAMAQTVGEAANKQRSVKGEMKQKAAPAAAPQSAADQMASFEALAEHDMELSRAQSEGRQKKVSLPQQIADKSFFMKNGQWQDASLTDDDLKNPAKVTQFSDEYFILLDQLSSDQKPWLTMKEPALVKIGDKVYLIEPPKEAGAK